jgi:hypothetical protein
VPFVYQDSVVDPAPRGKEAIVAALPLVPKLSCLAVTRVVFVQRPDNANADGWVAPSDPDLVFINYPGSLSTAKIGQTFLHESTHSAGLLLHAHASTGLVEAVLGNELFPDGVADADDWGPEARALAKEVVKSNRLASGFRAEWLRMHRTFETAGLAWAYRRSVDDEDAPLAAEYTRVALAGFMSNYGATAPGEDIAEMAGWMLAEPLFAGAAAGSRTARQYAAHGCMAMRGQGHMGVDGELSALFTKAGTLLAAGLVTEEAYNRCVRPLDLGARGPGVWVYGIGAAVADLKASYERDVTVSVGTHDAARRLVFEYRAKGQAEVDGARGVPDPQGTDRDVDDGDGARQGVGHLRRDGWLGARVARQRQVHRGVGVPARRRPARGADDAARRTAPAVRVPHREVAHRGDALVPDGGNAYRYDRADQTFICDASIPECDQAGRGCCCSTGTGGSAWLALLGLFAVRRR